MDNAYLQQVVDQRAELEMALKSKAVVPNSRHQDGGPMRLSAAEMPAVNVRVTGFWRWKSVVVPPNAFVVHTRRGRSEPINCGLGKSFSFNPYTDAYLVVPAAMQTIVVNANTICRERQGILVQGYVQWVIDDFAKAYKRLDFSDPVDPMRVVNVQLSEQAEATIKDAVATMSIDDVLADKQPIIEELTKRLRTVAEGSEGEDGLGLRIVTVQIKEAVVSSTRLWEDLQRPFRAERSRAARLAALEHESAVIERENAEERKKARLEIEKNDEVRIAEEEAAARAFSSEHTERERRTQMKATAAAERFDADRNEEARRAHLELAKTDEVRIAREDAAARAFSSEHAEKERRANLRAGADADRFDAERKEEARRAELQAELAEALANHEVQTLRREAEVAQIKTEIDLARRAQVFDAERKEKEAQNALHAERMRIDNTLSDSQVQAKLVTLLPKIAGELPTPKEYKAVSLGGGDRVGQLVATAFEAVDHIRGRTAGGAQ